jgi:uncharacterized membrane protein YfcA
MGTGDFFTVAGTAHSPTGFVLLGLVIGYLSGLFGVGGGFMLTPLLNSLFAIPFDIAVGSGLCQMIGASTTAVLRYRRHGAVDFKLAAVMVGGAMTGVVAGARLVQALGALGTVPIAGRAVPVLQLAMDVLFIALLAWIAVTIFTEEKRRQQTQAESTDTQRRLLAPGSGPGPYAALPASGLAGVSITGLAYLGLAVGLLTGMLGVGGGVVLIPLLIYGLRIPTVAAMGTSLVLIFFSAVVGTLTHALGGTVHLPIAIALLIGSTLGAQFGAVTAVRLRGERLRRWFGLIVLATTALLARDLFRLLSQ